MHYTVIVANNLHDLSKQVEEHMQSHWQLQGGIATFEGMRPDGESACLYFAQAMKR